jgi:antitoxin HicB
MIERQYTILLEPNPDEGIYTVSVPALPGCITQGATIEEAIAMAKDAIGLYLEDLVACGEPIPEEQEHPQAIIIKVAA